ncbi:hypothetical protein M408DRAFT_27027 [Serendipita vermifera MAFF 305830]|uniref:DUF1365-domain-containing protein n=1 Tax=Serendipita vermifera MAFF 305830 TaxID=933852 RepID=A0A0C3AIV6_SERVB|nr:hypothetical protein M408DRAFT_27027 [Serendipita vermifera MAFF 305830]
MLTILDGLVTIIASSLTYYLYLQSRPSSRDESISKASPPSKGFIVINTVSHARHLPKPSTHAFVYPTLTLFLNVEALTKGRLNLVGSRHGLLFGTGKRPWTRVMNIRPAAYLIDDCDEQRDLARRFHDFVKQRGLDMKEGDLDDLWLLTSPSYFGFEGINPLSTWFCYDKTRSLTLVLLEVHNTFGERHVYVLQAGVGEDQKRPEGVDHQWMFPRQFHVSPFNDRSGYYVCAISGSSHPNSAYPNPPLPTIRLDLLTSDRQSKLTAITRARISEPLGVSSFLTTLIQHPFLLFLSLVRISYQAAKLHYTKRLDVYPRPEPISPDVGAEKSYEAIANPPQEGEAIGAGVGWQPEGWIHLRSKARVHAFLEARSKAMNLTITLIPSNQIDVRRTYNATDLATRTLIIHYRSPLLFVLLFALPSPTHTLLLGSKAERLFTVSDEELFLEVFEPQPRTRISGTQRFRKWCLPTTLPPRNLSLPPVNALDKDMMWDLEAILVIAGYYGMEWIERALYRIFRARFVSGEEPWNGWKRLDHRRVAEQSPGIGSVRSEL